MSLHRSDPPNSFYLVDFIMIPFALDDFRLLSCHLILILSSMRYYYAAGLR